MATSSFLHLFDFFQRPRMMIWVESGHVMKELLAPAASRMWGAAMGSFLLMIGTENGHDVKH